jgi:hypothetical protein
VTNATAVLYYKADSIDNDESEYIFNSILRLVQSYGYTYVQLISLNTSDMNKVLIRVGIIRGKSTDDIFRSLSLDPFRQMTKLPKSGEFENPEEESLINSISAQQITFFRYLYDFFINTHPEAVEAVLQFLFANKKNSYRYI